MASPPPDGASQRLLQAAERNLLETPVEQVLPFHIGSGGGHPDKRTLVLHGGQPVIAKYAPPGNAVVFQQAHNEVAAWTILRHLRWTDLGATTVWRRIDVPGVGEVEAAVQTLFLENLMSMAPDVSTLDAGDTWRAALFDHLILNVDRGGHNYAALPIAGGSQRLKLFDHGHGFGIHGAAVQSVFVARHAGEPTPGRHRQVLEQLAASDVAEDLTAHLADEEVEAVLKRCHELVTQTALPHQCTAA